jgi:hypothetical protein
MVRIGTYMEQSFASRIDVYNASVALRQKPVDFIVLTCCAELKDCSVVIDNLYYFNESSRPIACTSRG